MGFTRKKKRLGKRDGEKCFYCGIILPLSSLTIDHKLPKARKGDFADENTVLACYDCNQKKGSKTYQEFINSHPI